MMIDDSGLTFEEAIKKHGMEPPPITEFQYVYRYPGIGKSQSNKAGWCVLVHSGYGKFGDYSSNLETSWRGRDMKKLVLPTVPRLIWDSAKEADDSHPYLSKKQVKNHGLRVDEKNNLLVPIGVGDHLMSIQTIYKGGGKGFLEGFKVKGGYYLLGEIVENGDLCTSEGYATAATIFEGASRNLCLSET